MGLCSALRVSASAGASRRELPLLSMILEFKEIYFLYNIVLRRKPAPHRVFDQRNTNLSLLGQKKNVLFPLDVLRDGALVSSVAPKYHPMSSIQRPISETLKRDVDHAQFSSCERSASQLRHHRVEDALISPDLAYCPLGQPLSAPFPLL